MRFDYVAFRHLDLLSALTVPGERRSRQYLAKLLRDGKRLENWLGTTCLLGVTETFTAFNRGDAGSNPVGGTMTR